jgi:hypothetical protein
MDGKRTFQTPGRRNQAKWLCWSALRAGPPKICAEKERLQVNPEGPSAHGPDVSNGRDTAKSLRKSRAGIAPQNGAYYVMVMQPISLKLPNEFLAQLDTEAKARAVTKTPACAREPGKLPMVSFAKWSVRSSSRRVGRGTAGIGKNSVPNEAESPRPGTSVQTNAGGRILRQKGTLCARRHSSSLWPL